MEPEIEPAEQRHPGTMNRAERRARRIYGPLPWQFKRQRDNDRRTPRLDGEPRTWAVEKFRRACGFTESYGLADELKRIA